jgi:hypothetical protein
LRWYAEQIYIDEKDDFESKRDFVEYMASFWNPEGVNKIKEARASKETHAFAGDQEFERQVLEEEYKNNRYVKAIMDARSSRDANNQELNEEALQDSGIKLPTNLKFLKDY